MTTEHDDYFASLRRAVAPLDTLGCPWCVAGGWAIDLHLGGVTRPHADVDVVVYRRDQRTLRAWMTAAGWRAEKAVGGELQAWSDDEWLALPVHEIHAASPTGDARLELLLNEGDEIDWRFRKAPTITRPRVLIECRSATGLPYLAPEVPLL